MDVTSHLTFVVSLILGLAVVELLMTLGRLVRNRERVSFYWVSLVWSTLIFMQIVQSWWVYFYVLQSEVWRQYFPYLTFLLSPMLLYLIASWILPRGARRGVIDLRAHHYREHRWIFGLMAASLILTVLTEFIFLGVPWMVAHRLPHGTGLLLFFGLAWSKNPRFHAIATVLLGLIFIGYLVTYNPPLAQG
jgi:hypothetical protein